MFVTNGKISLIVKWSRLTAKENKRKKSNRLLTTGCYFYVVVIAEVVRIVVVIADIVVYVFVPDDVDVAVFVLIIVLSLIGIIDS